MIEKIKKFFTYESNTVKYHASGLEFGDIILTRNTFFNGILGWAIQSFLREPFSHAAIYVGNGRIFQSNGSGAHYADLTCFSNRKICVLRMKKGISPELTLSILSDIALLEGKGYDRVAFLYLFWTIILDRLGYVRKDIRSIGAPWDNPDRYFCYQLVAFLFRNEKIMKVDYTNAIGSDFQNSPELIEVFNDLKEK